MELKDLAPWIAIAFTLALSILVPLFTQIANNNHQRKMQREKFEYEEKKKRNAAFESFLLDVGSAVIYKTKDNLEKVGSSLFQLYIYAPTEWMDTLDDLAYHLKNGNSDNVLVLMQKLARLISDELNKQDHQKDSKRQKKR